MKIQTTTILATSLALNLVLVVVLKDQGDQIKRLKNHNTRLQTWGKMMSDVVIDQVSRPAGTRMSAKVANDLEAYLILRQNKII